MFTEIIQYEYLSYPLLKKAGFQGAILYDFYAPFIRPKNGQLTLLI